MRDIFKGYYVPSEAEFKKLWAECIFSFDANVFLNLYRYSTDTRNTWFELLRHISDRCWVTHQAAFEFHQNRHNVIQEQLDAYERFYNPLGNFYQALENERAHPFLPRKTVTNLKRYISKLETELRRRLAEFESLTSPDTILDEISTLFSGKTGNRLSTDRESDLRKQGETRYKSKIPPGFKDESKDEGDRFGDLFVWFQLLDKASSSKKPMVFVTDDRKEDWWWIVKSKNKGPRPELIEEMNRVAGVEFYMYSPAKFMKYAKQWLDESIKDIAIEEVKVLGESQAQEASVEGESVFLDDLPKTASGHPFASNNSLSALKSKLLLSGIKDPSLPFRQNAFSGIADAIRLSSMYADFEKLRKDRENIAANLAGLQSANTMRQVLEAMKSINDKIPKGITIPKVNSPFPFSDHVNYDRNSIEDSTEESQNE